MKQKKITPNKHGTFWKNPKRPDYLTMFTELFICSVTRLHRRVVGPVFFATLTRQFEGIVKPRKLEYVLARQENIQRPLNNESIV